MTVDPVRATSVHGEYPPPAGQEISQSCEQQVESAYRAWLQSLHVLTTDASALALWQEHRYRFAHRVGLALLSAPSGRSTRVVGPVVYGIYTAAGLCYIGQTHEAERRLKDLPVGESHHLGNTLPPELWERVVVLRWPALLPVVPAVERTAVEAMGNETCGLAIEHALQLATAPLMNRRRRRPRGGWTERNLAKSRSRGALHAGLIPHLCEIALAALQDLAASEVPAESTTLDTRVGRIVLPGRILTSDG